MSNALSRNVVSFAQDPKSVIKLLYTFTLSLESLFDTIVVHFVGSSHSSIELIKNCKLLYVQKYIVTIWLTWLKMNHIGYKNTTMNMEF